MKKYELMAPAGDLERLKIAFLYGADAVYFGGKDFSMRANAKNFDINEIAEAVKIAHSYNGKVYVTVNIVFHDKNFVGLDEYLVNLKKVGVDAIIISDPSVIVRCKKLGLDIDLFLSTQESVLNYESAKFWKKQGIKRLVLAREASREDIKRIKDETGLDLECFIHGAMCTSISGKCVLSNYATGRDSNRGGCAQICRWVFDTNKYDQKFTMTPKDLHMVLFIKDMMDVGVTSFKVEGRMRSIYYIATVIYCYRKIIDLIESNSLEDKHIKYYLNILNRCANRESTPQFYDKLPGVDEQYFAQRDELSNQDFLGFITDYDCDTKIATIEQRNYFKLGDEVEFFGPDTEEFTMKVESIFDEDENSLEVARHPKMIVKLHVPMEVKINDMMRIKKVNKDF